MKLRPACVPCLAAAVHASCHRSSWMCSSCPGRLAQRGVPWRGVAQAMHVQQSRGRALTDVVADGSAFASMSMRTHSCLPLTHAKCRGVCCPFPWSTRFASALFCAHTGDTRHMCTVCAGDTHSIHGWLQPPGPTHRAWGKVNVDAARLCMAHIRAWACTSTACIVRARDAAAASRSCGHKVACVHERNE